MYYIIGCTRGLGNVVLKYYDFCSFKTKEDGKRYLKEIKKDHIFDIKHIDDINNSFSYYYRSSMIIK